MHDHTAPPELSIDDLGDRICELSAHIAAATYRLLVMIAEFDRRGGWAGPGMMSCAHWLNWKCGLALRSAREKVRVAHALADLPLISDAFSKGNLSYSKVRALTRIATPETEADLLVYARTGTAAHLDRLVSSYRSCLPADAADADLRFERRHLTWHTEADGSVAGSFRLPPEEGAIFINGIEKKLEGIKVRNRVPGATRGSAEPRHDRADALVELAKDELSGTKAQSSIGDRHLVMVHVDADGLKGGDAGLCHLEAGLPLASETARRILCDGAYVGVIKGSDGSVLDVGRKTRTIPPALRRALRVRDGCCRFPGCTHKAYVDGHHIEHWIDGGETKLSNLVLLCSFHHRLLHEGMFRMRVEPDGRFVFARKDGREISADVLTVEPHGLERANEGEGIAVNGKTINATWQGERCDYGIAVAELLKSNNVVMPTARNGSAEPPPVERDPNEEKALAYANRVSQPSEETIALWKRRREEGTIQPNWDVDV